MNALLRNPVIGAALLAGAVWLLFGRSIRRELDERADLITSPIADWWVDATHTPAQAQGAVVLPPDGLRLTLERIAANGGVDGNFEFTWAGRRYRITTRRPDNDYDAVLIGDSPRSSDWSFWSMLQSEGRS